MPTDDGCTQPSQTIGCCSRQPLPSSCLPDPAILGQLGHRGDAYIGPTMARGQNVVLVRTRILSCSSSVHLHSLIQFSQSGVMDWIAPLRWTECQTVCEAQQICPKRLTELRQARCGSNEVPVTSRLLVQGYSTQPRFVTVRELCVSEQELDKINGVRRRK
jgi:hypothetical protein